MKHNLGETISVRPKHKTWQGEACLFRCKAFARGSNELLDCAMEMDFIVIALLKDSDIVSSHNIRPVAFVANGELRVDLAVRPSRHPFRLIIVNRFVILGFIYAISR
jgi:hypothetical protein